MVGAMGRVFCRGNPERSGRERGAPEPARADYRIVRSTLPRIAVQPCSPEWRGADTAWRTPPSVVPGKSFPRAQCCLRTLKHTATGFLPRIEPALSVRVNYFFVSTTFHIARASRSFRVVHPQCVTFLIAQARTVRRAVAADPSPKGSSSGGRMLAKRSTSGGRTLPKDR